MIAPATLIAIVLLIFIGALALVGAIYGALRQRHCSRDFEAIQSGKTLDDQRELLEESKFEMWLKSISRRGDRSSDGGVDYVRRPSFDRISLHDKERKERKGTLLDEA